MVSTKELGGHVHTNEGALVVGRRRRRHSEEFKAEAVQACARPGVSMAAVALSYGINANLLRRWVVTHRSAQPVVTMPASASQPTFVPLALSAPRAAEAPEIRIELKRGATTVSVTWPVSAAEGCAVWMRELLR